MQRSHPLVALCTSLIAGCIGDVEPRRAGDTGGDVAPESFDGFDATEVGVDADPCDCPPTGDPCQENICNPATGGCQLRAMPTTTECDDGDACTRADRCGGGGDAGTCVGGDPVVCLAHGDCGEVGACNPLSGVCTQPIRADGALCEDAPALDGDGDVAGTCDSGECHRLPVISIGPFHGCAVLWDGGMRCWGRNDAGELGLGHDRDVGDGMGPSVAEAGVLPLPDVTAVATGITQTCAITAGALKCWGSNSGGALGGGPLVSIGKTPATTPDRLQPIDLGDGLAPIAAAPSSAGTCALAANGTVKCWGIDSLGHPNLGEVGTPDGTPIAVVPPLVLGDNGEAWPVDMLVRAADHACALSAGRIRCWGQPNLLGIGAPYTIGDDEHPGTAPIVNAGWVAETIDTSYQHTCAVSTAGGVYCWGENLSGALGAGTTPPHEVNGPLYLGADKYAVDVAVGQQHTCALLASGAVHCWGLSSGGQLGVPNPIPVYVAAAALPVDLGGPAADIDAGWDYTCAVMRDGAIRCWGVGVNGRLGNDSTEAIGDEASDMPPRPITF